MAHIDMTNETKHGGARPKTRADDGRTNNRPALHLGRKPKSFTLKTGDAIYVGRSDKGGNGIFPGELWRVTEITRSHAIFQSDNGDTVRLRR